MKTLTSFLSICFVSIILFALSSGCSHNNSGTLGPPSSYKVKTISINFNNGNVDTLTFIYDAMGRVLNVQPEANNVNFMNYVYNGNNVAIDQFCMYCQSPISGILNSQGLLTSIAKAVGYSDSASAIYTYDSNNFMLKQIKETPSGSSPGYIRSYSWADSCLVSFMDSSIGNSVTQTTTYTYYNIREYRDNGLQSIYLDGFENAAIYNQVYIYGSIWGGHSKYLLKTKTLNNITTSFNYTFDPYGRVATQTIVEPNGSNGTIVFKYTYY